MTVQLIGGEMLQWSDRSPVDPRRRLIFYTAGATPGRRS